MKNRHLSSFTLFAFFYIVSELNLNVSNKVEEQNKNKTIKEKYRPNNFGRAAIRKRCDFHNVLA